MTSPSKTLGVLVSLPAVVTADNKVILTKKFLEGMQCYVDAWDGPVVAIMKQAVSATNNLDNVEVDPRSLPFGLEIVPFSDTAQLQAKLSSKAIVLAVPDYEVRNLAALCRSAGVPCVYNTEYSLRTRLQIAFANTGSMSQRIKTSVWECKEELLHLRREIAMADGVQCNGTPTFDAYQSLTPSPLLYFDTRVLGNELSTDEQLEAANHRRATTKKLQLAFSGRLIAMKGAQDLVRVAAALRKRGVDFHLSIFGAGELEAAIREDIRRLALEQSVKLEGVLEFHNELLPRLRDSIDLFVCCHVQGDPSCTYLETMSAGVPIVGYANEAFAGLARRVSVAGIAPIGDVEKMADEISKLARDRSLLVSAAKDALKFARQHTFEGTFQRRIRHLQGVYENTRRA